jgi:hypothetical protein
VPTKPKTASVLERPGANSNYEKVQDQLSLPWLSYRYQRLKILPDGILPVTGHRFFLLLA